MNIIEELKKEPISSNYFNLLGKLTNYSGRAFEIEGVLEITVQKLKEVYPNLSDKECSAICHPLLMTGDTYRIRDFIIVENTLLGFINDDRNNLRYSDYVRICKIDGEKKFYRNMISYDFFFNFEESPYKIRKALDQNYTGLSAKEVLKRISEENEYTQNNYKNWVSSNQNCTGLSTEEETKYTHFIGHVLSSFLKDQGININVLPNDEQIQNGDTYLFIVKDLNFMDQDYSIFVDCNFIHLARSFAQKQDFSMNLLLFKGKSLVMTATLSQIFDKHGDCKIELQNTETTYFSLNKGYQKTTSKKYSNRLFFYSLFCENVITNKNRDVPQTKIVTKKTTAKKGPTTVKRVFPYSAIMIDSDKKDSLIGVLPLIINLPLIEIPSFNSQTERLAFLHKQIQNHQIGNRKPFVISGNLDFTTTANLLNLDTCFINSGLNDTESYQTTFEVPSLEKVKQIRLKDTK